MNLGMPHMMKVSFGLLATVLALMHWCPVYSTYVFLHQTLLVKKLLANVALERDIKTMYFSSVIKSGFAGM